MARPLLESLVVSLLVLSPATAQQTSQPTLLIRSANTGRVADMAVSFDGKWYATICQLCEGSGKVTIWSAENGFEYRSFRVGERGIAWPSISIAPDNRTIAVADREGVRLFDVNTAEPTSAYGVIAGAGIVRLSFHPKRMLLAVLDSAGTVRIRDLAANAEIFRKPAAPDSNILHFSPDGSLLAVGSPTNAHIWSWEQGREIAAFDAHSLHSANLNRTLRSRVVTPSGSSLQEQTAEQLGFFHFEDLVFSADSTKLALVHSDEINIVALPGANRLETIPVEAGGVKSCIFTAPGTIIVGGLGDSFRYDLDRHERSKFPAWSAQQFLAIPGGNHLLISLGDRVGIRESTGSGKWLSFTANKLTSVSRWQFSPGGNELLTGTFWGTSPMTVWDSSLGQADTRAIPAPGVGIFAISPDGARIAYYGSEGYPNFRIHIWNRANRSEEFSIPIVVPPSKGTYEQLAYSPDGTRLAAFTGEPNAVKIWSVSDGKVIATIPNEDGLLKDFSWSPDGRTIALLHEKSGVLIFDVGQSRVVRSVDPLPRDRAFRAFFALQYSRDGKILAVSETHDVYFLDASDWSVLGSVSDASGMCFSLSPDGHFLAYDSSRISDGLRPQHGLTIWDLQAKKIAAQDSTGSTGCPIIYRPDGKLFTVPRGGGIGILSAASAETLATLYRFGNDQSADWLVVTPDGLFDGTSGAWNQVSWRFSDRTFDVAPVEIFFNEYFYPGVLADIMAGKRPQAAAGIATKDRRQPQIQLSLGDQWPVGKQVAARNVKVKLEVTEAPPDKEHAEKGSGVRAVRLFRNGSLVRVWRGEIKLDAQGKATLEAGIPIVAGENQLTAYAFNRDNIKSSDAVLTLTGADSLKRPETFYVLAVGINKYANQQFNLNYAVADARDVGQEVQAQQQKLARYARVEVVPLEDQQATKQNLLLALQRLAGETQSLPADAPPPFSNLQPAQPEDAVLIYFAGHGVAYGDRFYLVPHDLGYSGSREAISAADLTQILAHSISDLELQAAVEKIDSGRLLLLIDACNSGQALEAEEKRRGPMNSKGLAQLAYEKGMYILAAAQSSQAALEVEQYGHGLLTFVLVEEGLKTRAAARQGENQVDVREWLDFAVNRVPQLQKTIIEEQRRIGRELRFTVGGKRGPGEGVQTPRVFYRREPEADPLVVAQVP